ncbi:abortive phage resistance protein [bacterium M00.F.Ca.ET.230.01.1.1]|nr:abortive phage resistance protein [bacterium M00.F.Ca.ET.230.01.1.1]
MASLNDFKLLSIKSESYFNLLQNESNRIINLPTEHHKARFGFYLFMLEQLTNVKDISDLTNMITDKEFLTSVFDKKDEDFGVDAVFIDNDNKLINLFNFKYRNDFKIGQRQKLNETFLSTKFINALISENTSGLSGRTKQKAEDIIECLKSKEIWNLKLFAISNEDIELDKDAPEFARLKEIYDLETKAIGLNTIVKMMSIKPEPVDAILHLNKDSILPFTENSLSSSISYVIRISIPDLLRITCNDSSLRNDYQTEDFSSLSSKEMDFNILFDNVRGLIINSKYNDNIYKTLQDEPSKFFMYNNGLTIIATDIISEDTNANKKIKLTIKNLQVVNGGQTLRTLHKFNQADSNNISNHLAQAEILIRVFKTPTGDDIRNKIAEYTNSQNAISNVDLKAITSEQIQIEQYLDANDIIYARKNGDIGISPQKNYKYKISIEKFGQILFSHQGFPEKASNQKKQIFDKYYTSVFGELNFDIGESAKLVNDYFEIKKIYESSEFESTDQKIFYIIYLMTKSDMQIEKIILKFEEILSKYRKGESLPDARKLINLKFKVDLDENIDLFQ